jgi:beta-lactam-binding protein with PASTA domain/predicted Ser/Thr protein kinase
MALSDTMIDRVFDGRYRVIRKLGAGGMADVYLAEDQELGRRVAIKVLNERHAEDEQFVERFRREAKSAAGLSHPNIVSIYDRGEAEGSYYIAMEYLDGRTLKELLVRNGPPPIPIAIDYARQILAAIGFAHRNGIVHRDIKPHNVVVGRDGRLKVTDFGIARSGASHQMTEAGSIIGTAQYLSPEQARGTNVDATSDLYSMGVVLYELLTGEVPFSGDAAVEIAMKHLSQVPRKPSELRPEVPHDLDLVVLRALAKDPADRYQSAEEMDADLARVAKGLAVSPETEEAATTVLAGAGITTGPTVLQRAPGAPPLPGGYGRDRGYYEYEIPVQPRRSIWPWLLTIGLVIAAAVAGWYVYQQIQDQLNQTKPVAVDNYVGIRADLARSKAEGAGLRVRIVRGPNETIQAGHVYDQNYAPGDRIDKGNLITLYVSTGPPKVKVPDVVGLPLTEAVTKLADAGLRADPHEVPSGKDAGTVTAQAPAAGDRARVRSTVRINVSKGPKLVSVQNVIGEPFENALSALQGAGFAVARKDVESDQPKGDVVNQTPVPGSQAAVGSTITLEVSKGPKTTAVSDVTGLDEETARATLESQGFKVDVQETEVFDPTQDGTVVDQNPPGGANAKPGSKVVITVGRFNPGGTTTTTPSP